MNQERFEYTVTDPNGLHARPAGLLVRKVQELSGEVTVEYKGKTANLKKLLAVMGLGIHGGDTVTITVEGEKAKEEAEILKEHLKNI